MKKCLWWFLILLFPKVTIAAQITSYQTLISPSDSAYTFIYDPLQPYGQRDRTVTVGNLKNLFSVSGYVPLTRQINGKALSSDISLTYADVSAVPVSRTVNGYSLSSNVSLSSSDVGLGSVSNINQLPMSYLDLDSNMTANSDTRVPSQAAVVTYVATHTGATTWGSIVGTLSFQTDLNTALSSKALAARTVNGHSLASDFSLTTTDLGIPNVTNTAQMPLSYLDTDVNMAANSNTKVPSQAATVSYVLNHLTNPTWGNIGGTLSSQTDLNTALTGKLSTTNLPSVSVNNEIVLFSGTTGKVLQRASTTGILKATTGVISAAASSDINTLYGYTPLSPSSSGASLTGITASQVGALSTTAFSGVAKITVGVTQPSTPSAGDLWVDTTGL